MGDLQGSLWLGGDFGLAQLRRVPVRTYTTRDGLPSDNVLSVCETTDGTIWVGTDHGPSRIAPQRRGGTQKAELSHHYPVPTLWPSRDGALWVAEPYGGLYRLQNDKLSTWLNNDQIGVPNTLYEDRSGRLWLARSDMDLEVFNPSEKAESWPSTELGVRDVRVVLQDREGVFWFGTKGSGLARWRDHTLSFFTTRDGLGDNDVWAIHEDEKGSLWLATARGLTRYHDGKFFAFTRRQGLAEDTVNCVLEDDLGCLWLSGLHGIYRIELAQLNAVAEGRASVVQPIRLGTADGMRSAETNGGENQPAGWKAHDGRLWFPTKRGVVVIDPKALPVHEVPPPVLIEQVKTDDQVLNCPAKPWDGAVTIPAGRAHVVEFQFTATTFIQPQQIHFRYRLQNADEQWSEVIGQRTARYINLHPGRYEFEVTAANHHGVWNPLPARLAFIVEPHFWQTPLFYLLCIAGGLALGGAVQAYRLRWQRRLLTLEQQRALADERARIARDLHDDLGSRFLQISVLSELTTRTIEQPAQARHHIEQLRTTSSEASQALEEIVWAANPKQDSLRGLVSYLREYVPQFLAPAGILCRLDFPNPVPDAVLEAGVRHELFLVVKEVLQNAVKHAAATEFHLRLRVDQQRLVLVLRDNGRGFQPEPGTSNGDGLSNMRERMAALDGEFTLQTGPGRGTELILSLPL